MKAKFISITFIGVLAMLFVSCEGNTDKQRIVENSASFNVTVIAEADGSSINEELQPGQTKLLFSTSQLGGTDVAENLSNGITSMFIINESGDTAVKDFTEQSNWRIEINKVKNVPSEYEHTYTFEVEDKDF